MLQRNYTILHKSVYNMELVSISFSVQYAEIIPITFHSKKTL